jgi:hydroxyacylglutathione hydrolase
MIFKQFYLESLGHASYFVGAEETGDALVLDVRRDVDIYFAHARSRNMRIRYALDTHQHNDFLTGICELPVRGGDVQLLASARAELGYPVKPVTDGARIEMGEVVFEVLETPGHTPEHISLLVTDRSRGEEPSLLLSGGALLVGDVARPDLLGGREETERHAAEMCRMLRKKILSLPDFIEVYPTHVAGSLCGGAIGSRLSTTIGYERRMNGVLARLDSEGAFVEKCLDLKDLPAVPPYWPRMRKLNQQGPTPLGTLRETIALSPDAFEEKANAGAIVLDCRSEEAFAAHIPEALNVGIGASFATWAGTVLPPDKPIILVLEHSADLSEVCRQLLRIGYDIPEGWLAGGMFAWRTAAKPLETLAQIDVWQLRRKMEKGDGTIVIDVRQPKEWSAGHIRGAVHITGAEFPERIGEIPQDRSVAMICGSGYRSSVTASSLQSTGRTQIFNVLGGMTAWKKAGLPTVSESCS